MADLQVVIPGKIAGYVRKKVAGGLYVNSEAVVCEALRRMEAEEAAGRRAAARGDVLESRLCAAELETVRAALLKAKTAGSRGSRTYDVSPGKRELSRDVGERGRRALARERARAAAK